MSVEPTALFGLLASKIKRPLFTMLQNNTLGFVIPGSAQASKSSKVLGRTAVSSQEISLQGHTLSIVYRDTHSPDAESQHFG
jgi:hypothetical protein